MKKIYSILLIVIAFVAITKQAKCQQTSQADSLAANHLVQVLNIQPVQALKVWAVMKSNQKTTDSLLAAKSIKTGTVPQILTARMQQYKSSLNALLTPAQMQLLVAAVAADLSAKRSQIAAKLAQVKQAEAAKQPVSGAVIKSVN